MKLIDTRTVYGIGCGVCNIYGDGKAFVVEVVCNAGVSSATVENETEAWAAWLHPFASLLTVPSKARAQLRRLTPAEHELLESLEAVEAGEFDAV